MSKIESLLETYCNELNESLESSYGDEIRESFSHVLTKMEENIPHSGYYWSRACYIGNRFNLDMCWQDMYHNPKNYTCQIGDDLDEHPGICIHFKIEDDDC